MRCQRSSPQACNCRHIHSELNDINTSSHSAYLGIWSLPHVGSSRFLFVIGPVKGKHSGKSGRGLRNFIVQQCRLQRRVLGRLAGPSDCQAPPSDSGGATRPAVRPACRVAGPTVHNQSEVQTGGPPPAQIEARKEVRLSN